MCFTNSLMKKAVILSTIIVMITLMVACYGDSEVENLSYDLVVATDRDLQSNFKEFRTYYISDTIPKITDDKNDSILVGESALEIVGRIKENLNALGYTYVDRANNPDLGVIPALLNVTYTGGRCSGWWGGYPGYWDPVWWGYPGYGYYYPFCGFYSYDTGTLSIDMIDLKNTGATQNLKAVWTATLFGVLSRSDETNINRALRAIDQAYSQSYYLENQ